MQVTNPISDTVVWKLADFGLVKRLAENPYEGDNYAHSFVGTPSYIAPEVPL